MHIHHQMECQGLALIIRLSKEDYLVMHRNSHQLIKKAFKKAIHINKTTGTQIVHKVLTNKVMLIPRIMVCLVIRVLELDIRRIKVILHNILTITIKVGMETTLTMHLHPHTQEITGQVTADITMVNKCPVISEIVEEDLAE